MQATYVEAGWEVESVPLCPWAACSDCYGVYVSTATISTVIALPLGAV